MLFDCMIKIDTLILCAYRTLLRAYRMCAYRIIVRLPHYYAVSKYTRHNPCKKQSAKSSFFLCFSNIGIHVA